MDQQPQGVGVTVPTYQMGKRDVNRLNNLRRVTRRENGKLRPQFRFVSP